MTQPDTSDKPTYQPSVKECARTGRPFIDIPYEPDKALRQALVFYLANYKAGLSLHRLQLLCFYTDYRYYQLHDEQLTDTTYYAYMHGMVSDDLERELDNSPATATQVYDKGASRDGYELDLEHLNMLDADLRELFEQFHDETRTVSTEDLETFCKNTPIWEHTEYEVPAEFTDETVQDMDSYSI